MTMYRRQFLLRSTALLLAGGAVSPHGVAKESPAIAALGKSQLIYLSPIVSGGKPSACHGEVWFVQHNGEVFVSTQHDAWRAEAIRRGFKRAKIWIGEFGAWKRAKGRYLSAPYLELEGRLETDQQVFNAVLEKFGHKYAAEWGSWGPKFRNGLNDGSRVMLRYTISS